MREFIGSLEREMHRNLAAQKRPERLLHRKANVRWCSNLSKPSMTTSNEHSTQARPL
jgi:hypothetical protein